MTAHPILGYDFSMPSVNLDMAKRMCLEYLWEPDFTYGALEEYKKFCFLAITEGDVTPSCVVDQVWHMHLLYTRHYWGVWTKILGQPLHHSPTEGGAAEDQKYYKMYARTLWLYQKHFGAVPEKFWPPARKRFLPVGSLVTVCKNKYFLLPRFFKEKL